MYNRVKGHIDHKNQSFFRHGLVKLIILTELKKKNHAWQHFLIWFGFAPEKIANQEEAKKSVGKQKNLQERHRFQKQPIITKGFKKSLVEELKDDLEEEPINLKELEQEHLS